MSGGGSGRILVQQRYKINVLTLHDSFLSFSSTCAARSPELEDGVDSSW